MEPNELEAVATTTEVPQHMDGRRPNQSLEGPRVAIAEQLIGSKPDPKGGVWMGIALTSSHDTASEPCHASHTQPGNY